MFTKYFEKLILIVGLIALGIGAVYVKRHFVKNDDLLVYSNNKATVLERPIPLSQVRLASVKGSFSEQDLLNKWSLLFFGYTHCPDVCPTTLTLLQQVDKALQQKGRDIQTIFVTLDPERDTIAHMNEYVAYFNKRFIGLSGRQQDIDALAKMLGVYYEKTKPAKDGGYEVNHTASIFLVNPQAEVKALFSTQFATVEDTVSEIKRLSEN